MPVKYKFFLLTFFFLFFIFAPNVSAQVVINEFSSAAGTSSDPDWPDWVEVYYSGVDIALYRLIDAAGNVKNLSDASCAGSFCTIDWSNKLNNPGDTIKLVLISAPDPPVDQVTYGETGNVCAPTDGKTAGRYPDETGGFVRFSSHTKGTSNTASQDSCPTPTPTPSPTPTPTHGPTSTPTPTPMKTPTATPKPTVKAVVTKKPKVISTKTTSDEDESEILGLREELEPPSPTPVPESEEKGKIPITAVLFVLGGLVFMGVAGYPFLKSMKKRYNIENEEKETTEGGFKPGDS